MSVAEQIRAAALVIRTENVLGSPGDSMVDAVAALMDAVAQGYETNPKQATYGLLEALTLAKLIGPGH